MYNQNTHYHPGVARYMMTQKRQIHHYPAHPSILIFGGGGHSKAVIDLIRALDCYRIAGIVDDHIPPGTEILGVEVLGGTSQLVQLAGEGVTLAVNTVGGIGNYTLRQNVFEILSQAGFHFPTLIHPGAFIEPSAEIDDGVQVLPTAYIGSTARVGFGSIVNAGVIISHDCCIGRVVNLSPGAMLAGGVTIDDYAQVGMGVTINLNLRIGRASRIGNGATIKADVPPDGRVYAGMVWPERIQPDTHSSGIPEGKY
jgi:acetyltransferase EpsM